MTRAPLHIAIIMDGNGRWATRQGKSRTYGHEIGASKLLELVNLANQIDIKYLSVYAFSVENFKRPKLEVDFLMDLFVRAIKKHLQELIDNNTRIIFSGRRDKLSKKVVELIEETTTKSANNSGLIFNICLNYGGTHEIVDAIKSITNDNILATEINEELIGKYLYQNILPPIDLMIRTSGEQRISNFMLWQLAYAEFYFTNTLWPDFTKEELKNAIDDFKNRDRRFGGLKND